MQRLVGALDGVLAQLGGKGQGLPNGTEFVPAGRSLEEETRAFQAAYQAEGATLSSQEKEVLNSKLASVGRQLARLDSKAAAVLRRQGAEAGLEHACLAVGCGLQVLIPVVDIASTCSSGAGSSGARACRELAGSLSLLLGSGQRVLDALLRQGHGYGAGLDALMLNKQVTAGCGLLSLLTADSNPQGVLDSAASMFTPAAVLPWLETLADGLAAALAKRNCEDDKGPECLLCFGILCGSVLKLPSLARVAAALQADSKLLRKLQRLLMQHCLPAAVHASMQDTAKSSGARNLAHGATRIKCTWEMLHSTITAVLELGLEAALPMPSSPDATSKYSSTLAPGLTALTTAALPDGEPETGSAQTLQGAAQEAAAPTSTQRPDTLQPTQLHCVAAAARLCGLAEQLVGDLPLECPEGVMLLVYVKTVVVSVLMLDKCVLAAQLESPGDGQTPPAVWHRPDSQDAALAAIRALPKLAALLFTLTSPPASELMAPERLKAVSCLWQSVISTASLELPMGTVQQAAEMMQALSAVLRIATAFGRMPLSASVPLSVECVKFIVRGTRNLACLPHTFFDDSSSNAIAAAAAAAYSLHTAACRMVHWAPSATSQTGLGYSWRFWQLMFAACSAPLHIMGMLERASQQGAPAVAARERLGMYAAHWEAMQEVIKKLEPSISIPAAGACQLAGVGMHLPAGYLEQKQLEHTFNLAATVVDGAVDTWALGQAISQPGCQGMFRVALALEASTEDTFASSSPDEAAVSVDGVLMGTHWVREVTSRIADEARLVAAALRQHPQGGGGSSQPSSSNMVLAGLEQAAARVQACLAEQQDDEVTSVQCAVQQHLQLEARVLPAAKEVAGLLQLHWQQPQQQAATRLEMAQAAATRSCAYLHCTNLAGEGGPSAGQGAGSLKCSACRAVWYCSTACSHADWRQGGHRRVCKALAAERQRK